MGYHTMTTKTTRRWGARLAAGAIVLGGTLALTACDVTDRLLQVDNPEEIPEDRLDDPLLIGVLVNGVIGDFQAGFDDPFIWRGSMLTDEQVTGININPPPHPMPLNRFIASVFETSKCLLNTSKLHTRYPSASSSPIV